MSGNDPPPMTVDSKTVVEKTEEKPIIVDTSVKKNDCSGDETGGCAQEAPRPSNNADPIASNATTNDGEASTPLASSVTDKPAEQVLDVKAEKRENEPSTELKMGVWEEPISNPPQRQPTTSPAIPEVKVEGDGQGKNGDSKLNVVAMVPDQSTPTTASTHAPLTSDVQSDSLVARNASQTSAASGESSQELSTTCDSATSSQNDAMDTTETVPSSSAASRVVHVASGDSGIADTEVVTDQASLRAVLQFLRKNNLKEAEETLLKEAKLEKAAEALLRTDASDPVVATVPKPTLVTKEESDARQREQDAAAAAAAAAALAQYQSDAEANIYERQYGALSRFIETSLDSYRFEMALVTYPLFVHMYLELIYNGHDDDARRFFQRFSYHHLELYSEDVKTLSTLTTKNHMVKSPLMEHFKTGRFVVRMSRDTYQGLRRHLHDQQLTKILEIVQERLYIDVYDGAPRNEVQVKSVVGAMEGEAIRERNRVRVLHGLLREPELAIPLEEDEDDEEKEPETKKKKKSKKDSMLVKKSKNDPNAPPNVRIPLPEPKEVDKIDRIIALRDSAKRVKVDDSHPVSICFYTLLNAHRGCTAIDVSDDSSLLATGFADSYIRVWSLTPRKLRSVKVASELGQLDVEADDITERMLDDRTAAESKMLLGHSGPVYSLSFSSDRQYLVSSSEDATIRLWSLVTFTNLIAYKGHNFAVWCVRFAPCGHYFVSGGQDRTARVWSTDHHQPLRLLSGHLSDVDVVAFHPNVNYVATGSTDRTVRLWDVSNGRCLRNYTGHKGPVQTLCFSPSGRYLASAGTDGVVYLWNIPTGYLQGWFRHDENVLSPTTSASGKPLLDRSNSAAPPGSLFSAAIHALAFSRDGGALASGGLDESVCVWNVEKFSADYDDEEAGAGTGSGGNDSNQPLFDEKADYLMGRFPTKKTPVLGLHFTRRNLLLAFGPHVHGSH